MQQLKILNTLIALSYSNLEFKVANCLIVSNHQLNFLQFPEDL